MSIGSSEFLWIEVLLPGVFCPLTGLCVGVGGGGICVHCVLCTLRLCPLGFCVWRFCLVWLCEVLPSKLSIQLSSS